MIRSLLRSLPQLPSSLPNPLPSLPSLPSVPSLPSLTGGTQVRRNTTMSPLPELSEVVPVVHPQGVLELRLNTPKNLNAFGGEKYLELIKGFDWARDNDDIKAVVVTSTGRYFSAGAAIGAGGMGAEGAKTPRTESPATKYIAMLIDFPKLAVCALQGPAYGIAVTTLPLFDLVYAVENVTLTTPFSRLGISLEGCSSVTFPPLFGNSLTTRLLYLAETVPMDDLRHTGLFAGILDPNAFQETVIRKVQDYLEDLAFGSIVVSKAQIRTPEQKKYLHKVNIAEMAAVDERHRSQEHKDAIKRFQEKAKAKAAAKKAGQAQAKL